MDAPDIVKWVNKDELLLTTGYAIKNNKDYVTELIKGLKLFCMEYAVMRGNGFNRRLGLRIKRQNTKIY
jgi:hypothetical protein